MAEKKKYDSDIVGWYTRGGKRVPIRKGSHKGSKTSYNEIRNGKDLSEDRIREYNAETERRMKSIRPAVDSNDVFGAELAKKHRKGSVKSDAKSALKQYGVDRNGRFKDPEKLYGAWKSVDEAFREGKINQDVYEELYHDFSVKNLRRVVKSRKK